MSHKKSFARASWYVGPSSICPRAGSLHFHTLTRSIDDFVWSRTRRPGLQMVDVYNGLTLRETFAFWGELCGDDDDYQIFVAWWIQWNDIISYIFSAHGWVKRIPCIYIIMVFCNSQWSHSISEHPPFSNIIREESWGWTLRTISFLESRALMGPRVIFVGWLPSRPFFQNMCLILPLKNHRD